MKARKENIAVRYAMMDEEFCRMLTGHGSVMICSFSPHVFHNNKSMSGR